MKVNHTSLQSESGSDEKSKNETSGISLFGKTMSSGLLSNGVVVVGSPPRIGAHVSRLLTAPIKKLPVNFSDELLGEARVAHT